MHKDFSMVFVSDLREPYLTLEVHFKDQRLFKLTRGVGEQIDVEVIDDIYVRSDPVKMKFPIPLMIEVINEAADELKKVPKVCRHSDLH